MKILTTNKQQRRKANKQRSNISNTQHLAIAYSCIATARHGDFFFKNRVDTISN